MSDEHVASVELNQDIRVPLRDGTSLAAGLYRPRRQVGSAPCIVAMTPYVADHLHERAMYFARQGFSFLAVDVRGRGNSPGEFHPLIQEANDGHDVIEWAAAQPFCDTKVAMFGGSYLGYAQWAATKELPRHLVTIVPTSAPCVGVDFPLRKNIFTPYLIRWLSLTSGNARQNQLFADEALWGELYSELQKSGRPLRELDSLAGSPSVTFQEWLSHPTVDGYWDRYNPTPEQYSRIGIPVLTITGIYDGNQPGALEHYKRHVQCTSGGGRRAEHYLVIGPWDHSGCGQPATEFQGVRIGQAALLDMLKLHAEWYAWTLRGGAKPEFLKDYVAYYVMVAERWAYAPTLGAVTARAETLYLSSSENPVDVYRSGTLTLEPGRMEHPDQYLYDPKDVSYADVERARGEVSSLLEQRGIAGSRGGQLIYHTLPFLEDVEITGFFKLTAWIAIDQPDTDFSVTIYDIDQNGGSLELCSDWLRARYRQGAREAKLVGTQQPQRYDFENFTFVSRILLSGHRLRLVFGPLKTIYEEKNYNSGRTVCEESAKDARPVTVKLFHDQLHPSVLLVPVGQQVSSGREALDAQSRGLPL